MFHDANSFVFINRSVPMLCKQHDKTAGKPCVPFPFFIGRTWPYRPRFYRDEKLRSVTRSIPTLASRWLLRSRQCLEKKKSRIRCVFPIVFFFAENFFSPLHSSFTFFLSLSLSCSLCRLCLTSKRRTIKYWESSIMGSVPWDKRVFGSMCKWFRMYNTLEIGIKIWIYVFDYGR